MDDRRATLLGWATLARQSDYGQFYLIDPADEPFEAPTEIADEMLRRGFVATPSGLVVYTNDCLQQHIHLAIHDGEPAHPAANRAAFLEAAGAVDADAFFEEFLIDPDLEDVAAEVATLPERFYDLYR